MLCYIMSYVKTLSKHSQRSTETVADGAAQTSPCPSSPSQGVIRHQLLCKPRGAQDKWECKLRVVSGKAQPQCPGKTLIMIGQEEQLHNPLQTMDLLPRGVELVMGCWGREFWDCVSLTVGYLGKKPEIEKGMDSNDLGRNSCEKIKVRGDKQSWKCVNSSLSGHAPTRVVRTRG